MANWGKSWESVEMVFGLLVWASQGKKRLPGEQDTLKREWPG